MTKQSRSFYTLDAPYLCGSVFAILDLTTTKRFDVRHSGLFNPKYRYSFAILAQLCTYNNYLLYIPELRTLNNPKYEYLTIFIVHPRIANIKQPKISIFTDMQPRTANVEQIFWFQGSEWRIENEKLFWVHHSEPQYHDYGTSVQNSESRMKTERRIDFKEK